MAELAMRRHIAASRLALEASVQDTRQRKARKRGGGAANSCRPNKTLRTTRRTAGPSQKPELQMETSRERSMTMHNRIRTCAHSAGRALRRGIGGALLLASIGAAGAAQAQQVTVTIPAAPGGGWDGTARLTMQALQSEKLVTGGIQFVNKGGGVGIIGLTDFVRNNKGNDNAPHVHGRDHARQHHHQPFGHHHGQCGAAGAPHARVQRGRRSRWTRRSRRRRISRRP